MARYLLEKVSYLIPYFINLLLREVDFISLNTKTKKLTKKTLDTAFNNVVKENKDFKDWKDRLFEYYSDADAKFMNEVLAYLAHYDNLNIRRLYDLAIKHKQEIHYMDLIEVLENDGYILENNESYAFISPFLKAFWRKNQPIYTETK